MEKVLILLVLIAVIVLLIWLVPKWIEADSDGWVDARHSRDHDYHEGVWRWVYERAYARERRKRELLAQRANERNPSDDEYWHRY